MLTIIGAILSAFMGYANKRSDADTAKALKGIEAEIELNREKSAIVRAQLGHWIAWFPRFTIEMTVAFYVLLRVIDRIFDLPGIVQDLQPTEAAVMSTALAGMFLKASFDARSAEKIMKGKQP